MRSVKGSFNLAAMATVVDIESLPKLEAGLAGKGDKSSTFMIGDEDEPKEPAAALGGLMERLAVLATERAGTRVTIRAAKLVSVATGMAAKELPKPKASLGGKENKGSTFMIGDEDEPKETAVVGGLMEKLAALAAERMQAGRRVA